MAMMVDDDDGNGIRKIVNDETILMGITWRRLVRILLSLTTHSE